MDLSAVGEKAVRLSKKLGADESEAYITSTNGMNVVFTDKIESVNAFTSTGFGIRVIVDKRIGFYSTSSTEERDIEESVKTALAIAKISKQNPEWVSLATKSGKASVKGTFDKGIEAMEPDRLVDAANLVIDGVLDYDRRLVPNRSSIGVGTGETIICNSYWESLKRKQSFASASLSVKAEEAGKKGLTYESSWVRNWKEIDFQTLLTSASDRALKIMNAKSIPSGKMPIVWRNIIIGRILSVMLSRTLCADAIQNKRSPWIGRLGEPIASDRITLTDDGLREAGVGTREFDDEGIPQQATPLISKGVLKNYLYDSYTANKDKTSSTGNAHRGYTGTPSPGPNNLTLKPTNTKKEELIKDTKRGLYVAETIGEWLSNSISGDLSATVVNGFLIENGELTQPVKDVVISGNFFDILKDGIDLIASDLINSGTTYAPSVRVKTMTVTDNR